MAAKKRPTRRQQPKPSYASRIPQPPTSDVLVYTEYEITEEPLENRHIKKLPAQVQARIDDLYELAQHDPTQVIPELERLVTTYPHVPTFFNYLSIAYLHSGDQEKATACVREAYRRHPQYLFAKVNYANLCLQHREVGKIPGIFDQTFDLKQLYPHRKRFHLSEFTGFAWVMCRYFCAIGERETATLYYQMLKQVAPRHPMTVPVKLSDIIEGLEFQSDACLSYLNTTTGEVVSVTTEELRAAEEGQPLEDFPAWQHDAIRIAGEILATDHYLPLPDRFEINEYRIMERFCLSVDVVVNFATRHAILSFNRYEEPRR